MRDVQEEHAQAAVEDATISECQGKSQEQCGKALQDMEPTRNVHGKVIEKSGQAAQEHARASKEHAKAAADTNSAEEFLKAQAEHARENQEHLKAIREYCKVIQGWKSNRKRRFE